MHQEIDSEEAGKEKRIAAVFLSVLLLVSASALADSAVDTIMSTGATQAFTDDPVSAEDLTTILRAGLATQNMVIAAASLGYGVKIVSSPTMTLNGSDHDAICEKLGVDPSMQAVAVLLIGRADDSVDATSSSTTRDDLESKTRLIE